MNITPKKYLTGAVYTVFAVREENDKTEGRGGSSLVGYFHDRKDADTAAVGKGVFGNPGQVSQIDVFSVDGGVTGYPFNMGEAVTIVEPGIAVERARILAKLSDRERRILGL